MIKNLPKNEEEWRKKLGNERYEIMRGKGTEGAFTGSLLNNKENGKYMCAACGTELFSSETKFDSGSGWPSFYDADKSNIVLKEDVSHGMKRTEVICKVCGSHLGHLFNDAPQTPTGNRFCINSAALNFRKK